MAVKKKTTPRKKVKKKSDGPKSVPKKAVKQPKQGRNHPKFGTSKLEQDFATEFLDKLGVDYVWQYESNIGRFYDFAIKSPGGGMILVEIDGDYYHSNPSLVKEEDMSPMQKRNKRVDEMKNQWALMHSIPLIRIWEKDIRENPKMVMDYLKERLYIENTKQELKISKNKRHINKLNNLKDKKENDKH